MENIRIFTLLLIVALGGCSTTSDNSAEDAVGMTATVVAYTTVFVFALPFYPFLKSMNYESSVTKEDIREMLGEPIATYDCDGDEVWEFSAKQIPYGPRFVWLSMHSGKADLDENTAYAGECVLKSGTPSGEDIKAGMPQVLPCGGYYKLMTRKKGKFNINMGINKGIFMFEADYSHYRQKEPVFEIYYENELIYSPPKLTHYGGKHGSLVEYGPGYSTIIEVAIPHRVPRGFDFRVSCPLPCETKKDCLM